MYNGGRETVDFKHNFLFVKNNQFKYTSNIKILSLFILICGVIFLCGCTKRIDFKTFSSHEIYKVKPLNVSLDEKLSNLVEETQWIDVATLEVHGLLSRVFNGTSESKYGLIYVDSSISTNGSDVMLIGTRFDTRYNLAVNLIDKSANRKKYFDVFGKGTSYSGPITSSPAAVEDAVLKLYRRIEATLE